MDTIEKNTEIKMKKCIQIFKSILLKIRTNRASPVLLDGIYIEYYGKKNTFVSIIKLYC